MKAILELTDQNGMKINFLAGEVRYVDSAPFRSIDGKTFSSAVVVMKNGTSHMVRETKDEIDRMFRPSLTNDVAALHARVIPRTTKKSLYRLMGEAALKPTVQEALYHVSSYFDGEPTPSEVAEMVEEEWHVEHPAMPMKKFAMVGFADNGDVLFQPAGRAVEYAINEFDALRKLFTGNVKQGDYERLVQVEIFDVTSEDEQ